MKTDQQIQVPAQTDPAALELITREWAEGNIVGGAGLSWQGNWNSVDTYDALDAVYHGGSSWRALRTNTNVEPTEIAVLDWAYVAKAGADGDPGPAGTTDHDLLTNVRPADPASSDTTRNKHASNADIKKLSEGTLIPDLLTGKSESSPLSDFPAGVSFFAATGSNGTWPQSAASGLVQTVNLDPNRSYQIHIATNSGRAFIRWWSVGTSAWSSWSSLSGIPPGGNDGDVITKSGAVDFSIGWEAPAGGGGLPTNRLNYVSTTDIHNGTGLVAATWTNCGPSHSFTPGSASSLIQIMAGGVVVVGGAGATVLSRVLLDGATPLALGGQNSAAGLWVSMFAGATPIFVRGLSAASHTLQVQVKANLAGCTMYCRSATQPGEELVVKVEEWPA